MVIKFHLNNSAKPLIILHYYLNKLQHVLKILADPPCQYRKRCVGDDVAICKTRKSSFKGSDGFHLFKDGQIASLNYSLLSQNTCDRY